MRDRSRLSGRVTHGRHISDSRPDVANGTGALDAPDAPGPQTALVLGRVLVVDDEAMAGEFIGELLAIRGLNGIVKTDPSRRSAGSPKIHTVATWWSPIKRCHG